jgi:hypothetical protein
MLVAFQKTYYPRSTSLRRLPVFCLLVVSALLSLHAETFRNPRRIPTPVNPEQLHAVDLNGDGRLDLYYGTQSVSNATVTPTLRVLLAQPDGSYQALPDVQFPAITGVPGRPVDVNGDGIPDLVTGGSRNGQNGLITLIGRGDGTFQGEVFSMLPSNIGTSSDFSVFADFNGDSHADIYLTNGFTLLGDGTGHFSPAGPSNFRFYPASTTGPAVAADVNGDHKLDILYPIGAIVALGNGDGSFSPLVALNDGPRCIYADVDLDSTLDAVCGTNILHGKADGTFDATPIATLPFPSSQIPASVAVRDVNRDGIMDVISTAGGGFAVSLGQPGLQFAAPVFYPSGYTGDFFHTPTIFADMNNDGNFDFVVAGADCILITYGRSDGTFDSPQVFQSGDLVTSATVADFNGDGVPDVVTSSDSALSLLVANGDGTFASPISLPSDQLTFSYPILHGDFNGDGKQDLFTLGTSGHNVILLGHGDGTFSTPLTLSNPTLIPQTSANRANQINITDLNQDGRSDVLTSDGQNISVFLADSDGKLASSAIASPIPRDQTNQYTSSFVNGDFNKDGVPDTIVALQNLYFLGGKGDGSFAPAGPAMTLPQSARASSSWMLNAGDFDGDENLDIVMLNQRDFNSSVAYVLYGRGDGTFSAPVLVGDFENCYGRVQVADLDADGRDDLIFNSAVDGTNLEGIFAVGVVHSLNGRSFGPVVPYTAGQGLNTAAIADFNRDAAPDLLFTNIYSGYGIFSSNTVTVLTNIPGPTVSRSLTVQPEPSAIGQAFNLVATLAPPQGSPEQQLSGSVTFLVDGAQVGSANLANGVATLPLTTVLSLGVHRITAIWAGDTLYPSVVFHVSHTITKLPVTVTIQSSPIAVGQKVTFNLTFANGVTSPGLPPTGTFTILDGDATLGTGSITDSHAAFALPLPYATAAAHTITVKYSGDSAHATSTGTLTVAVNPAATTTSLQSATNTVLYGNPLKFTIQINPLVDPSTPALLSSGAGTISLSGLPGGPIVLPVTFPSTGSGANPLIVFIDTGTKTFLPGTYTVSATFSGNTNLLASTSTSIQQIISPPPSNTVITFSPSTVYQAHPLTLTATVTGIITTPTGSVQFLDGATVLGTSSVAAGVATFSTRALAPTNHSITAIYAGDANNAASTSAAAAINVLPYDFALPSAPPSATVKSGASTTVTITTSSIGTFAEDVIYTIASVPSGATATFSPATVTLTAAGTSTTTLTINTRPVQSAGIGNKPLNRSHFPGSLALASLPCLIALSRRRRHIPTLFGVLLLSTLLVAGITGCGGSDSNFTPPGTYNLQITANSSQSQQTHTVTIPLTVNR